MSLAEELLNSMSEEVQVHSHPVPDTDTYFIIDPITRKIENTNRKKTVIMQYDHNSERFTFELPRYVDGHDMMECTSVTVNVDNIEAETGTTNSDAPDMTDLRIHPNDPEKVISSWLITRNSTQLAGHLSFHIEYKCADSNGNVVYEWATDSYDEIQVKARKKNGESAVIEHTDLLEQWRARIFGAGDSVMANIEAEGKTQVAAVKAESETQQEAVELKGANTLETIPEDYTNVNNMAEEAMRTKTDAIVLEAAGDSITLKDSSDDHIRGLKLFGKSTQVTTNGYQLFDATRLSSFSSGGVTITNNEHGSFTIAGSGTMTANVAKSIDYSHEETMSILKTGMLHGIFVKTNPYIYAQIRNKDTIYFGLTHSRTSYEITQDILDDPDLCLRIGIYGDSGDTIEAGTFTPVLYQDGDGVYEPYTGGKPSPNPDYPQEIASIDGATVTVTGKNLLNHQGTSKTMNGVTFTVNADKSIHVHGTATGSTSYYLRNPFTLPKGSYIMSGCPTGGSVGTYRVYYSDNVSKTVGDYGQPAKFTLDEEFTGMVVLQIYNGAVIDNLTFYPMIRPASFEDESYEPYIESQTLTLDRTLPGIPVTSGGNYTDSDGQQWICDEVDLERGVYVKRIVEFVADDTLAYEKSTKTNPNGNVYFTLINKNRDVLLSNDYTSLCDNRTIRKELTDLELNDSRIAVNSVGSHMCIWFCSDVNTVEEMKESMGVCESKFLLPIATPIETPLNAEEITAFKSLRTNYPNTTILNDAGAWMSIKYNADTKAYIDAPKVLKLTDSSTGVVYELKIVNGTIVANPVQ